MEVYVPTSRIDRKNAKVNAIKFWDGEVLVYSTCGIGKRLAWSTRTSLASMKKFDAPPRYKEKWNGAVPFLVLGCPFCGMGRGVF